MVLIARRVSCAARQPTDVFDTDIVLARKNEAAKKAKKKAKREAQAAQTAWKEAREKARSSIPLQTLQKPRSNRSDTDLFERRRKKSSRRSRTGNKEKQEGYTLFSGTANEDHARQRLQQKCDLDKNQAVLCCQASSVFPATVGSTAKVLRPCVYNIYTYLQGQGIINYATCRNSFARHAFGTKRQKSFELHVFRM